ncbi:MAG: hypothetical protein AUF67_02060 [Acidobacteria bacterium 13_1_20CM_58_21]|nr:MAG: hypothetical protein AUF67_02060 [Acidobacteria bacterium 13_1_20CM_58_21]
MKHYAVLGAQEGWLSVSFPPPLLQIENNGPRDPRNPATWFEPAKRSLPDAILEIHQEDGWLAKIGGVDFRKVAIRAKIDSGIIVPSPFQFSGLRGKE